MLLDDPDVLAVLRNLYRVRSATVQEFAALDSLPTARLGEILSLLETGGYLLRDGDQLTPIAPDTAVAASVASALASLESSTALLGTLPLLARDWELGESGSEYALSAEIIHGHRAQWEAWGRYAMQWPPNDPICLYPDLQILETIIAPDVARVRAETGITTVQRAILPAAICADPANLHTIELLIAGGVELRTLARVPYWIYVDDGVYAAVPVTWDEHPPNSIIIIRQPNVVSALSFAAETMWGLAVPFTTEAEGWESVLRLLAQGLSDKAIATALDTSMRTVQRRIGEAMQELGATSRFELGVAYERDRAARDG